MPANNLAVSYTIILGEEELKTGSVQLRDMSNSQQQTISQFQLFEMLK